MQIYFKEVDLAHGFTVAREENKHSRIIAGKEVSMCSGIELFKALDGDPIMCYKCGCIADRWILTLGQNDRKSKPVMNLYGVRVWPITKKRNFEFHQLVLMTRDHIIPKSEGGKDDIENLRPACEICNGQRGSKMTKDELAFMSANPHLICPERRAKGIRAQEKVARMAAEKEERRLRGFAFP